MNSTIRSEVQAAAASAAANSDGNWTKGDKKNKIDFTQGYMKAKANDEIKEYLSLLGL